MWQLKHSKPAPLQASFCNLWTSCSLVLLLLINFTQESEQPKGTIKVIYAVNAGGPEHTDRHGIHYEADRLRTGIASDFGNTLLMIERVPEQDEILYRTERYHTATFGYEFPTDGDGDYALVLHFCEVYFNAPRMKVFDVMLNKKHTIVSQLDIYNRVGRGSAHEEIIYFKIIDGRLYYNDEVSDVRNERLRLDFIKTQYDNPKINAFALLKGDVEYVPRLPPLQDDMPSDADMAVFKDRLAAAASKNEMNLKRPQQQKDIKHQQKTQQQYKTEDKDEISEDEELDDYEETEYEDVEDELINEETQQKTVAEAQERRARRKTSGPRHPDPYTMDDSSVLLPVFIAIGAFIPLLFCLCKL